MNVATWSRAQGRQRLEDRGVPPAGRRIGADGAHARQRRDAVEEQHHGLAEGRHARVAGPDREAEGRRGEGEKQAELAPQNAPQAARELQADDGLKDVDGLLAVEGREAPVRVISSEGEGGQDGCHLMRRSTRGAEARERRLEGGHRGGQVREIDEPVVLSGLRHDPAATLFVAAEEEMHTRLEALQLGEVGRREQECPEAAMRDSPSVFVELRLQGGPQRLARKAITVGQSREHPFAHERFQRVEEDVPLAFGQRDAHLEGYRAFPQAQGLSELEGWPCQPADSGNLGVEAVRGERRRVDRLGQNPGPFRVGDDPFAGQVLGDVDRMPGVSLGPLLDPIHESGEVLYVAEHRAKEAVGLIERQRSKDELGRALTQGLNGGREVGAVGAQGREHHQTVVRRFARQRGEPRGGRLVERLEVVRDEEERVVARDVEEPVAKCRQHPHAGLTVRLRRLCELPGRQLEPVAEGRRHVPEDRA